MQNDLTSEAVSAALGSNWQTAVELNNKILKDTPKDLDALNRLGKAYLELGETPKAIACFKKVLKNSRFDPIATKNLARATTQVPGKKNGKSPASTKQTATPICFLEEPGKTRIIALVNLAPPKSLMSLNYTDSIKITSRRHTIIATDQQGNYIGAFPDDLGHRLLLLTKGGNEYDGFVKSVSKNSVTIFAREIVRSKKFRDTPSFPTSGNDYLSFVREDNPSFEDHISQEESAPVVSTDEDDDLAARRKPTTDDEETEDE